MRFDQQPAHIEADDLRVGARGDPLAHVRMRDRVERLVDRGELIAADFRLGPQRDVVRRGRRRQEQALLLRLKVLERAALRATVAPEAVVIEAPVPAPGACLVEGGQHFAGEAIVADARHGAFDAPLVLRVPHARRVDVKVAGLRILEKRRRDARVERIRPDDDGLRVIRNQDLENAAEKLPRRFTRFDGARGCFLKGGIDEAMPRAHRGKNPRAKSASLARQDEPADPSRVHLQLLTGLAIEHRDRRRRLPKLQLEDREAVQRRIRNVHTLPDQ
jgi:hypothetical protein